MPLEAFAKLRERKKINIFNAISNSLKVKNYDDLSVNDISIAADISRGSFYNYFVDKHDAVSAFVDSKIRMHINQYMYAIQQSNYSLFEGTKKIYDVLNDKIKNEISTSLLRDLKFFVDLGVKSFHSKEFEHDFDDFINWLVNNTIEGKLFINDSIKMANIFEIIISLLLNCLFFRIILDKDYFEKYNDFEYRLNIIKKGIELGFKEEIVND